MQSGFSSGFSGGTEPANTEGDNLPSGSDIRMFAMGLLARREYAIRELEARLVKKWGASGELDALVGSTVAEMVTEGLVSDERFAEAFVRSRMRKLQGPLKVRAELYRRQVPESIAVKAIEEQADRWPGLANEWLQRQAVGELDYAARARYYRRLTSRGFSHEQAMRALNKASEAQTN